MFPENINWHPSLEAFGRNARKQIKLEKDLIIANCGFRGIGKTYLSIVLAYLVNKKFDFEKNFIAVPFEGMIEKKLEKLRKGEVLIIDEPVHNITNMDFNSVIVRSLYKKIQRERKEGHIIILNMGEFTRFPKSFRDDIFQLWIQIFQRGRAVVLSRDKFYLSEDRWWIEQVRKDVKGKSRLYKRLQDPDDQIEYVLKMPNAIAELSFPPSLFERTFEDTGIKEQYLAIAKEANKQVKESGAAVGESNIYKKRYGEMKIRLAKLGAYLQHMGFPLTLLSELTGSKNTYMTNLLSQMGKKITDVDPVPLEKKNCGEEIKNMLVQMNNHIVEEKEKLNVGSDSVIRNDRISQGKEETSIQNNDKNDDYSDNPHILKDDSLLSKRLGL